MSFRVITVPVDDPRAVALRDLLDDDLAERYGAQNAGELPEITEARTEALRVHAEDVVATWIALEDVDGGGDGVAGGDGIAVGHVMLRRLGDEWELKRLVVPPWARRRGVASMLLTAVLDTARAGGARRVILQTGEPQTESVALYVAAGFTPIPVYEPYRETMPNSLCFALPLE